MSFIAIQLKALLKDSSALGDLRSLLDLALDLALEFCHPVPAFPELLLQLPPLPVLHGHAHLRHFVLRLFVLVLLVVAIPELLPLPPLLLFEVVGFVVLVVFVLDA